MYDSNTQAVSAQLAAASSTVFTQDTIDSILSLIAPAGTTAVKVDTVTAPTDGSALVVAEGTNIVFVATSDTEVTKVVANVDVPAIFFQGKGGVDATIGTAPTAAGGKDIAHADATAADDAIVRVVVGTEAADKITIADGKNTQVIAGDGDEVIAGTGHDVVVAAQGASKVVGGGHTIVEAVGLENDFVVAAGAAGHAVITNGTTGVSVDLTNVHYVDLTGDDALIIADNETQATVANLYHAVFGRNADAAGLDFWFDVTDEGASLTDIANAFLTSDEYEGTNTTDAAFVASLYTNVLGRAADTAGAEFWVESLASGATRADVVIAFAEVATNHVEANEVTVVGSVTVIDPIA
jgi:hypothetical protein